MSAVAKFAKKELLSVGAGSATRVNVAPDSQLINLGAGDPDFNQPTFIGKAVLKAMKEGHTHYTFGGVLAFKEAIANYYSRYGPKVDPATQITLESGGSQAIFRALGALLNPGDEIMLMDPAYGGYNNPITYFGAKQLRAPMKKDKKGIWRADIKSIEKAVTPKTKALIICNPDNPTGAVYSEKEISQLCKVAVEKDFVIISDEIYTEFCWGRNKFHTLIDKPGMLERTLVLMSFSKTFAWTGCRAGYIIAGPEMTKLVAGVPMGITGMPVPFQYAGMEALNRGWPFVRKMRRAYKERLDFFVKRINEIEGILCPYPEGTFYVFPDISSFGVPSAKFISDLFQQEKVRGAAGSSYGKVAEGYVRFALVADIDRLEEAANRIERYCKKLN